jgi:hypothetical protein
LGPVRIARNYNDLARWHARQQVIDGRAVERAGSSGDDDHDLSFGWYR